MQEENIWNLVGKRLSGEASEEELIELENLLRSNPELHYPIQTIMDIWNPSRPQIDQEVGNALEKHLERMKNQNVDWDLRHSEKGLELGKRKASKKEWLFGMAAFLIVFSVIALLFEKNHILNGTFQPASSGQKINSEISTKNGSKTNLILPDGSQVWLNAGSKLSYDKNYGNTIREINLTGEAFFDVVHNVEKPFIIHTSIMDIKVLGTRFNVKSYPSDKTTEATLIRGSIEVFLKDRPNQKIILKPSEKIIIANAERVPKVNSSTKHLAPKDGPIAAISNLTYEPSSGDIVETSWLENKLIFQDEPFKEVAAQMERRFGVTIRFYDPVKEELRFTGSFQNETVQQALDALKLSVKFNYSIMDNEITIYDN